MRFFKNIDKEQQKNVANQFSWLLPWFEAMPDRTVELGLQRVSFSVFDHWLSEEEAYAALNKVDRSEQAARDARFFKFAVSLSARSDMLAFTWRGQKHDVVRFRRFASAAAFFDPASRLGGMRNVVLPALDALLTTGYDDTWDLIFRAKEQIAVALDEAANAGLYVLAGSG